MATACHACWTYVSVASGFYVAGGYPSLHPSTFPLLNLASGSSGGVALYPLGSYLRESRRSEKSGALVVCWRVIEAKSKAVPRSVS